MSRIKKFFAVSLILCMVSSLTAKAADTEAEESIDTTITSSTLSEEEKAGKTAEEIYALEAAKEETATENAYNMKTASNEWNSWPEGPGTYGEAAIVMEAGSGTVLYAKNIDGKAYPASITKVLTALLALENGKLEDKITITDSCIDFLEYGDAHIGLSPGEEITLNDALHALLLASANEAAYAIGENTGDGYEWFIKQMNTRAKELGAVNTNFVNTNGLNDDNHYTTARDMALITRELYNNHKEFQTISQTLEYTIPPTNLEAESRVFQQKHKMFYEGNQYYYENVTAGKTGYTEQALNTLITCADDGNMQLICVVMKTHGKHVYTDTRALFDYGFANFHKLDVKENETSKDYDKIEEDAYVVLPGEAQFKDLKTEVVPDEENGKTGVVNYLYEGNNVGSAKVTFSQEYIKRNAPEVKVTEKKQTEKKQTDKKANTIPAWAKGLLIIAGAVVILVIVWFIIAFCIRKKRMKKRKKRQKKDRKRR